MPNGAATSRSKRSSPDGISQQNLWGQLVGCAWPYHAHGAEPLEEAEGTLLVMLLIVAIEKYQAAFRVGFLINGWWYFVLNMMWYVRLESVDDIGMFLVFLIHVTPLGFIDLCAIYSSSY